MNKDRKIQLQQRIINDLQEENKRLTDENIELKSQMDIEKNTQQVSNEKSEQLIKQLERTQAEYEKLLVELKEKHEMCETKLSALRKLEGEYDKKMKEMVSAFERID